MIFFCISPICILYRIKKPLSVQYIRVYISRIVITEIFEFCAQSFYETINTFFLLPRSKVRNFGTNFTAESPTFMHWSSYMRALYNSGSKNVNNLKRQNLSALC